MTLTRWRAAVGGALLSLAVTSIIIATGPPAAGTPRTASPTPSSSPPPEVSRAMCDEGDDPMPISCPVPIAVPEPHEAATTGHYRLRNLTATGGEDFRAVDDGLFTIDRGATTAQIPVDILGDSRCEADESVLVEIFSVAGGAPVTPVQTEVVIRNDDAC
jgi:hypothetical protein